MIERASRAFIELGVRATAWACRFLINFLVARAVIATAVLILATSVAVYALWIRTLLWMTTGRFGIVRLPRWQKRAEITVTTVSIAALLLQSAAAGRTAGNMIVIGLLALMGAVVCFHREHAVAKLRDQLVAARR
jgi:hypothetical protein